MAQASGRKGPQRTKFEIRADIARELEVSLPDEKERTISPNEAAEILGITGEAVKQWIYNGRLPAIKLGNGYWRIKVSDLSHFLKKRLGSPQHSVLITPCDKPTLDAIVKVVTETSVRNHGPQVAIGGGDDAHVHGEFKTGAHAADPALLQRAQKFSLHADIELGNFIEEKRAAVGNFEKAFLISVGAGE